MTHTRKERLAPSIRRAHARVQVAWYASVAHAALLFAVGIHFFIRSEPAWILGGLSMIGVAIVPQLGRAAYHGQSLSALLLVLTVAVPPVAAFFLGWDLRLALPGLLLLPPYYLGLKGSIGLRGRRSRGRAGGRRKAERR